jgi:glycosyltransferase involved in cell wall biosynthesis
VLSLAYAGSLINEKGLETMLEVRRLLAGRGVFAHLYLIGSGDSAYVDRLKSRFPEDEIIWHGEIAHPDVRRHLRAGHFFLFPTRFIGEGHANALNEAMAEGLVPVVSDHGANADVVADAGRVLPVGADAQAYADAITDIWREGWLAYSHRASARIREQFWAPKVIDRLIAVYRDLAAGR